jgi:hypothetical protein
VVKSPNNTVFNVSHREQAILSVTGMTKVRSGNPKDLTKTVDKKLLAVGGLSQPKKTIPSKNKISAN